MSAECACKCQKTSVQTQKTSVQTQKTSVQTQDETSGAFKRCVLTGQAKASNLEPQPATSSLGEPVLELEVHRIDVRLRLGSMLRPSPCWLAGAVERLILSE